MKQERMKILSMIEEGKISVDEATRLLEVLGTDNEAYGQDGDFQEKFQTFSRNVEDFAKDVGTKASAVYKEMEPKLKAATRVVVEETANVVDDLSRMIHESLDKMNKEENKDENKDECCCEDDEPKSN